VRPALVLLDRDGVINHDSPDYILSPEAWQPIPGSLEAIARLTEAGIAVAVCSNQSAIGRGKMTEQTLARIHEKLHRCVTEKGGAISAIHYCPHAPQAGCHCRKPLPGLIEEALKTANVPAAASLMIGDSQRDLEAARAAGVDAWLVRTGNGEATEKTLGTGADTPIYDDLAAAVEALLANRDD